jgi:hypothetical protein
MIEFHVEEHEFQCVDIEVLVRDPADNGARVIVATLHLSPTEALTLAAKITAELTGGKARIMPV